MHSSPSPWLRLAPALALLLAACGSGAQPESGAPERPRTLGMCATCHGIDGIAPSTGNPHLAGQDEAYLRLTLRKYKSGERRHPPMQAVVGALSEAELDELARWYASMPRNGLRAAPEPAAGSGG